MSTCNFITQDEFPLYAYDTDCYYETDEDGEPEYGNFNHCWYYSDMDWFQRQLEEINKRFTWHKIELRSGYYTGEQLFVQDISNSDYSYISNPIEDAYNAIFWNCPEDIDAKRCAEYITEQALVRQAMREFAYKNDFIPLVCVGVFSNGEAVFRPLN